MSFPEPPPVERPDPDDTTPLAGPADALDSHRPSAAGHPGGRRGVVAAGMAVLALVAAGGTGAVLARGGADDPTALAASTSSSSASPSTGDNGKRFDHRGLRGGPGMLGLAGAVHGELVVPDGSGGYRTLVVQRGTATEVGADAITVKSEDGFTKTYMVPADAGVGALREGLSSIETGANVVVMADKDGSTLTATHVMNLDTVGRGMGGFGRGLGDHGPGGRKAPAPSTDAQGSLFGI